MPQVASVSVHLPSLRTSHGPSGLYNDCKRGEADGPVKGNQTSPVPGRLADQGPVSGRSTSKHSDSGGPNSVLRVDNNSGEPVLTARCLMLLIGLLVSMKKMVPEVSPQRALEISSVIGHPPSLGRKHFCIPRLVAKSHKCDERRRPSSKRPQHPTLYRRLKQRLGCSPRANLCKRSVVKQGKKATHKCCRAEGGFSGPSKVQGPVSKPNSVSCHRQINSGSLHKQAK